MRKLLVTLIALGFSGVAMAGISTDGAPHNFFDGKCGALTGGFTATPVNCDESWNDGVSGQAKTAGEICVVCHTPHFKDQTVWDTAQLWNHQLTQNGTWTMYPSGASTTIDGTVETAPTGTSKLCLGCHDGVTALNAYGTHLSPVSPQLIDFDTTNAYRSGVETGTDLSNSHPVSIAYSPGTGAGQDPDLHATTNVIVTGVTVADVLVDNRVECSSCHDPHGDRAGFPYLTRVTMVGSAMCLGCHDK